MPPPWLTIVVLALSGWAGARAAATLDLDMGYLWLGALSVFALINAVGFWMDPGRRDNIGRDQDPRASSTKMARLGLLIVVAQLPAVSWRLVEGDPETRLAKAWVVGTLNDTGRDGDPDAGLPESYAPAGITQVEARGRTWLLIARSLSGTTRVWSYDVEGGRWKAGRP